MSNDDAFLRMSLELAVPMWIDQLRLVPLENLMVRARTELADFLAAHGDRILFRSKKKGETAEAFNRLAESVAILSFAPGGVTTFGLHFEAVHPDAETIPRNGNAEPTLHRIVLPWCVCGVLAMGDKVVQAAPIVEKVAAHGLDALRRWVTSKGGTMLDMDAWDAVW